MREKFALLLFLRRTKKSSKKKEGAFEKNAVDLFSLPLCVLSHRCALFEERRRGGGGKRRDEEEKREFEQK